jgi:hypothetical protein
MEEGIMWKRLLCRFGWHNWTPWDAPKTLPNGKAQQFRMCNICKKQQRYIF